MSSLAWKQVHSKSPEKPGEAGGPAAQEAEDPIEGSPAPVQQEQDAAVREMNSPSNQERARQRKQLKPIYVSENPDEGAWNLRSPHRMRLAASLQLGI